MTALELKNLKFKYSSQTREILDIKSLKVDSGRKVFIQGASGSGKSTLLNIIGGVLDFHQGEVEVLGKNLRQLNKTEVDQFRGDHMGFIFQQFNLIPYLNTIENIQLPLEFSAKKRERASDIQGETQRLIDALKIPQDVLLKKPYELSVGQQQRVAAARALMGKPELIIADEPTSSLDYEVRDSFLQTLFEQVKNTKSTLLFVSHDISLRGYFDEYFELKGLS